MVLLPAPLLPTKAEILPPSMVILILFTALSWVASYLKLTLSNLISVLFNLKSGKDESFLILIGFYIIS